jgi:hypothetical protein
VLERMGGDQGAHDLLVIGVDEHGRGHGPSLWGAGLRFAFSHNAFQAWLRADPDGLAVGSRTWGLGRQ